MSAALALAPTEQWFELPQSRVALSPPERRGLERDGVRMMITTADSIEHGKFVDVETVLLPGDLLVVNDSATLPAAVDVESGLVVHFSTMLDGGFQVVEIRDRDHRGSARRFEIKPQVIELPGDGKLELLSPYPVGSQSGRLWLSIVTLDRGIHPYLAKHGRPVTYDRETARLPITDYQTVFSRIPGSAEMPSAARPFTTTLVTRLVGKGVRVAPVTLHAGVSSLEIGERPYPEWFEVPSATSDLVNHTRSSGHRVIAVGTTVVRALETVSRQDGRAHPGRGWTDLYITDQHSISVVDGLVTGWHEPTSTHLEMLTAIAGKDPVHESYQEALAGGYLWHEFGDSHLILS